MYLPWLRLKMLGWTHLRELAVKSAVGAARFLIDAGRCGWGNSFGVCLSVGRADAAIGPSTPAS